MKSKMDYIRNFGLHPRHQDVYQDTRDTSHNWRQERRICHPLSYHQYRNKFMVGDRVTMRMIQPNNNKMYGTMTIIQIIQYETVKTVLGSYNRDDAFNGYPFTHVLILDPPMN